MKYQKTILLLLVVTMLFLCGCTVLNEGLNLKETENFKIVNKVEYPSYDYDTQTINNDYLTALNEFSSKVFTSLYSEKPSENHIFSPISLYMALSMLLEGTMDNSYEQLATFMDVDNLENLRTFNKTVYNNNYYKNNKGELEIHNSMWTRRNSNIYQDYIDTITNDYYAELYDVDFSKPETLENIVKWINYYTKGLLDLTPDEFKLSTDLTILLLNTIYFNNTWEDEFEKENNRDKTFYTLTGEVTSTFMYHQIYNGYYGNDDYEVAVDNFNNGNTILYILPNEDLTVSELLEKYSLNQLMSSNIEYSNINLYLPKFKYNSNYKLIDTLKSFGVTDIFNRNANLDKMQKDLYVSSIIQDAAIELSEKGVKAAAVTGIMVGTMAAPTPIEVIEFDLNRPFIYVIRDVNNVPLFTGVLNNPQ